MNRRFLCALLPCLVLGCQPQAAKPVSKVAEGKDVIAAMEAAYAKLDSYSDNGTMTAGKRTLNFRTLYAKPDMFLFEFTDRNEGRVDHSAVWSEGGSKTNSEVLASKYLGYNGKTENAVPLGLALAAVATTSAGTAITVPNLLLHEQVRARALSESLDWNVVGEEAVDGVSCNVVRSTEWNLKLWIDKKTNMIRMVEDSGTLVPRKTTYTPVVNPPLTKEAFKFKIVER